MRLLSAGVIALFVCGCFEGSDIVLVKQKIPKGFLARFESVTFKQVNFAQKRWIAGEAKALNAHPFKLKFDLEQPRGTFWFQEGKSSRDFLFTKLRLRGQKQKAKLDKVGVVGLGEHQWLRLTNATLDQEKLDLVSNDEAWVISPNTWLRAPKGVTAQLNAGEVEANGPVRFEAFP